MVRQGCEYARIRLAYEPDTPRIRDRYARYASSINMYRTQTTTCIHDTVQDTTTSQCKPREACGAVRQSQCNNGAPDAIHDTNEQIFMSSSGSFAPANVGPPAAKGYS